MGYLAEVKTEKHAAALEKRDRFLSSHPELRDLQKRIDTRLKGATGRNRLVLIHSLMMDSFLELDRKLQNLLGRSR